MTRHRMRSRRLRERRAAAERAGTSDGVVRLVVCGALGDPETPSELLAVCTSAQAANFFAAVSPRASDSRWNVRVIVAPADQPLDEAVFHWRRAAPAADAHRPLPMPGESAEQREAPPVNAVAPGETGGPPYDIERYTPERRAEFLLQNAVDAWDYADARELVRSLGIDRDAIPHETPPDADAGVVSLDPDMVHGGLVWLALPHPPEGHGWRVQWRATGGRSDELPPRHDPARWGAWIALDEQLEVRAVRRLSSRVIVQSRTWPRSAPRPWGPVST